MCSSILRWGTEEQKREYLPKLCSGEWLACFGLTEPDTGSDAANQRTRAREVDGGWRINGAKMWISMGNHAKVALVFAQTDPELGHRGLACFLVDTDQPGFQPPRRSTARWACTAPTPRDLARRRARPETRCSARSATASRSR